MVSRKKAIVKLISNSHRPAMVSRKKAAGKARKAAKAKAREEQANERTTAQMQQAALLAFPWFRFLPIAPLLINHERRLLLAEQVRRAS